MTGLSATEETLGSRFRAERMIFGFVPLIHAYVRITDSGENFLLEVCPPNQLPNRVSKKAHRVWYKDGEVTREEIAVICMGAVGGKIKKVNKPFAFLINNDGQFVSWGECLK